MAGQVAINVGWVGPKGITHRTNKNQMKVLSIDSLFNRENDMESRKDTIPTERIEDQIYTVRGKRVMLDADLARLYGVTTKRLNEQVRRNADRFPDDFAFKLEKHEVANLKSQIATSNDLWGGHGGRRYQPRVFTEHGAIMVASVLNSPRAVEVSVFVVRAFVKLRELTMAHKEIRHKLDELERKVSGHDHAIAGLVNAIRELWRRRSQERKGPLALRRGTTSRWARRPRQSGRIPTSRQPDSAGLAFYILESRTLCC